LCGTVSLACFYRTVSSHTRRRDESTTRKKQEMIHSGRS
jgi:hypothetical protein